MAHDVFICHSSTDRTIANAICSTLEQHRIRCWIAPRDVIPGSDYAQSIVEAIGTTRLTVLVFSDSSNHSGHVRREIERSVSHGVPILPFRVEDVVPSPSLEYFISDAHWLDAMTPPLEQHLDHLAETVRLLLDREAGAREPVAGSTPAVPPDASAPAAPSPVPAPLPPTPPATPRGRRALWLALGGAALVVAAVIAALLLLGRDDTGEAALPAAGTAAPTATAGSAAPPSTPAAAETDIFVDDFEDALEPGWTWVNEDPSRWSLTGEPGSLQITAQTSPPVRNVLLRDGTWAGADYAISTVLRFGPSSNFQFAGLVITGPNPDGDRLQFGRAFCEDTACVGDGLYFDRVKDGSFVGDNFAFALPQGTGAVHLSLDLGRTEVSAWYSLDEGENWEELGAHPLDPGYTRVGLLAHNAPSEVTATFEDFAIILP